ncbi:hypothetical protein MHI37_04295 [Paenibacillus sp. FSL H8-0548]|uniref:hypothetical protein n=1 Tax=Paenibacillus sp. FSL H8-0548 TaxID=1920422 RepID=UPI0015C40CCF|nr:hypothetical protein [Paenibacillus sp. FSL H8-0548]
MMALVITSLTTWANASVVLRMVNRLYCVNSSSGSPIYLCTSRVCSAIQAAKNRKLSDCVAGKPGFLRITPYARVSTDTEEQLNSYKPQVAYYADMVSQRSDCILVDTLKYVRLLKERRIAVFFEKKNINTLTMDG